MPRTKLVLAMVAAFLAAVARRAGRSAAEVRKSVVDMINDCNCGDLIQLREYYLRLKINLSVFQHGEAL